MNPDRQYENLKSREIFETFIKKISAYKKKKNGQYFLSP